MDIDTTTGSETESATVESAKISASANVTSLDQEVSIVLGTSPRPYSTGWLFTGPLIEKYGIELSVLLPGDLGKDGFRWLAAAAADAKSPNPTAYNRFADEPTPLEAICSLLLQLHKAGKL